MALRIRSITAFLPPTWPLSQPSLRATAAFLQTARQRFTAAGFDVQTVRLASVPFPLLAPLAEILRHVRQIEAAAADVGIDYLSLGPALPSHPDSYRIIPELLAATRSVFFSAQLGDEQGIHPAAVQACAEIIMKAAEITPDGFTNLRFTALANVRSGTPFFPAAYGDGKAAFAIATEAADLAVDAFSSSDSLISGRSILTRSVEDQARAMQTVAEQLASESGLLFSGIDFTLAPFPEQSRSVGTAMERMGLPAVGLAGSLASAAILTDTLDQAVFQRTGFCGLMLPVLEDSTLAQRAADETLNVFDLLLYSAVCGTGLDCVPLPGDTPVDAIFALLLDLAALSYRLAKPLTARLMPIPGKSAGDEITFDFPYFASSRVMSLKSAPLSGALTSPNPITLHAYKSRPQAL